MPGFLAVQQTTLVARRGAPDGLLHSRRIDRLRLWIGVNVDIWYRNEDKPRLDHNHPV